MDREEKASSPQRVNLAGVPLLSLLDDEECRSLAAFLESRRFDAGAEIFSQGDPGDSLFIVKSGCVKAIIESDAGEEIVLAEYNPGDVFGEISLLDGGVRTATGIAVTDSELLALDRDSLLDFLTRHPHASLDLMTVMGQRLRATDELLRTRVSRNPNEADEESLTFGQRIADRVAEFGGSWTFIIFFAVFLGVWIGFNAILAASGSFDPPPFILLNLILSTLAALQAPIIMMSQNRHAAKDRVKADLDYQINLKSELEVAQLHRKLDRIHEEVSEHLARTRAATVGNGTRNGG